MWVQEKQSRCHPELDPEGPRGSVVRPDHGDVTAGCGLHSRCGVTGEGRAVDLLRSLLPTAWPREAKVGGGMARPLSVPGCTKGPRDGLPRVVGPESRRPDRTGRRRSWSGHPSRSCCLGWEERASQTACGARAQAGPRPGDGCQGGGREEEEVPWGAGAGSSWGDREGPRRMCGTEQGGRQSADRDWLLGQGPGWGGVVGWGHLSM